MPRSLEAPSSPRWNARGLSPEALRALCARIAASLRLDVHDDLHHLMGLFRYDRELTVGEAGACWREFLVPPQVRDRGVGLYVHVPFCEALCSFCFCPTSVPDKPEKLERYAESLEREIGFFAPIFAGRSLRSFFVGGGSPSILSPGQLRRVLGRCAKSFVFESDALFSVECNPKSTDPAKLEALRGAGFNRVSFGVQSMDARVLESIHRGYQTRAMVAASVEAARRAGFEEINLDFLLGLMTDDDAAFLGTFREAAELRPTTFTVCGLSLTEGYIRSNRLNPGSFESRYQEIVERLLGRMGRLAGEYGYRCDWLVPQAGSWVFISKECPEAVLKRMGRCYSLAGGPASTLGLGPYSQSRIHGSWLYERSGTARREFTEKEPVYLARRLDLKQEMMRHLLYVLEIDSGVSRREFSDLFGVDVLEAFAEELGALEALGQVRVRPERIDFLPKAPASRFLHAMFLLRDVLHELPLKAQEFRKQRIEAWAGGAA